jgi:hypothetical protein
MEIVEDKRNETIHSECKVDCTFSRANVVAQQDKVRLVDVEEDSGIELYCYNRCSNDESEFIKGCRGLVYSGDQLVMRAFSYTDEYNHTEEGVLQGLLSNFSEWSFYEAFEGALLRLFYFSGKWFLSTHRKLNAFRSKWSSRDSFGTLFKNALENESYFNMKFRDRVGESWDNILDRFYGTLDKSHQYMFLVRNSSENRIVCLPPKSGEHLLYHVGTFVNGKLCMTEDIGLVHPERKNFSDLTDVLNYINNHIDIRHSQGVVCFGPDLKQIKIYHRDYQNLFRARGNEPSVKFRYLQVRMNKQITDMLYNLYPDMSGKFDEIENNLYDIGRGIFRAYVQRFIKKLYVTVPREEYKVINECHAWHLLDRQNNITTLEKVIEILNKQSPTNLNHMIRRLTIERNNKKTVSSVV